MTGPGLELYPGSAALLRYFVMEIVSSVVRRYCVCIVVCEEMRREI